MRPVTGLQEYVYGGVPWLADGFKGLPPKIAEAVEGTVRLVPAFAIGGLFTCIIMVFEDTVGLVTQEEEETILHDTVAALCILPLAYTGLLVPTVLPSNCQVYTGVLPPLPGVAINVTGVPVQTGLLLAAILNEASAEV